MATRGYTKREAFSACSNREYLLWIPAQSTRTKAPSRTSYRNVCHRECVLLRPRLTRRPYAFLGGISGGFRSYCGRVRVVDRYQNAIRRRRRPHVRSSTSSSMRCLAKQRCRQNGKIIRSPRTFSCFGGLKTDGFTSRTSSWAPPCVWSSLRKKPNIPL
jgi:hypothetical protein